MINKDRKKVLIPTATWGSNKKRVFLMAQACLLHTLAKSLDMEKKLFGIILTVLGIVGLIAAAVNFVNSKSGSANVKLILTYSILGAVFFFAGIGLIKGTKDTTDTNRPS